MYLREIDRERERGRLAEGDIKSEYLQKNHIICQTPVKLRLSSIKHISRSLCTSGAKVAMFDM